MYDLDGKSIEESLKLRAESFNSVAQIDRHLDLLLNKKGSIDCPFDRYFIRRLKMRKAQLIKIILFDKL